MNHEQTFIKSFPKYCEKDIHSLSQKVNLIAEYKTSDSFIVNFNNETLHIPYRNYFKKVNENNLNDYEQILISCVFTRHHDGYTRQQSLEKIIFSEVSFITPFVIQLLGEYIIQIIDFINDNLSETLVENMFCFAKENPKYVQLTKQRMISYWNCYYRHYSSKKADYVGLKVLEKLNL